MSGDRQSELRNLAANGTYYRVAQCHFLESRDFNTFGSASIYVGRYFPSGSLPVSLSGPIANPTTRQKSFLTLMNSKTNRQRGRDPPVYCNLLSSYDRTSEQKSKRRVVGFAIRPDTLTGSSPVSVLFWGEKCRVSWADSSDVSRSIGSVGHLPG
jgi:hypothetical protein